jgi:hypothetical protein
MKCACGKKATYRCRRCEDVFCDKCKKEHYKLFALSTISFTENNFVKLKEEPSDAKTKTNS